MSAYHHYSHPTANKIPSKKRSYSNYLVDINHKFKQLTDNILPAHPYVLSVPTDRPFRLGSRYVSNWAVGENQLFAPEEENLQYMTFLPHQGEDTLLVSVGGWSDENGNMMEDDDSKVSSLANSSTTTTSSTPAPQSNQNAEVKKRKKITLSDYKKRASEVPTPSQAPVLPSHDAPKFPTSTRSNGGVSGPKQGPHIPSQTPHHTNQQKNSQLKVRKPDVKQIPRSSSSAAEIPSIATTKNGERNNEINGIKHLSSSDSIQLPVKSPIPSPSKFNQTPLKKLRLSPAPDDNKKPASKKGVNHQAVPVLLSPTLPFDPAGPSPLPPLLSPTLPPDIEADLAKIPEEFLDKDRKSSSVNSTNSKTGIESNRSHSNSISSASNSGANNVIKTRPSNSPVPKPKPSQPSSITSEKSQSSRVAGKKPVSTPSSSNIASKHPVASSPSNASKAVQRPILPASRPKLLVKLKYGRQNRKRIDALLKISSKRKPTPLKISGKPAGLPDSLIKDKERIKSAPLPLSSNPIEKPREPSAGSKRPKPVDSDDTQGPALKRPKSSTPAAPPEQGYMPSISTSRSTATKHPPTSAPPTATHEQFLTPRKDAKATKMRRIGSGDSDMRTPTGGPGSAKLSPGDNQVSKYRESERRGWREEYARFVSLGRELKHASQRNAAQNQQNGNSHDKDDKLCAATAVEAVLCFTMAFVTENRAQVLARQYGDSTGWRSIIAYWQVVLSMTSPYPHLHGLCLLLGAISHEAIHALDLERLAASAIPDDHSPAPTPGSDGTTVTSNQNKSRRREFNDLKARLPESYKEARRLWLEGLRELPDSSLARHYPNTWDKRAISSSERGREQPRPGEYAGEYYLPLSSASSPLEAVRFACNFLNEWAEKEGIKWKGKLGL
ncbi:hypothetical protein FQN57_006724 [Myotisia sp. PD_48]|nr:hypothetical protein FQN57_006724 [Myotisia sp. PD_48]